MSDLFSQYIEVALRLPLPHYFTYRYNPEDRHYEVGMRIVVPFHGRQEEAIVVAVGTVAPGGVEILEAGAPLDPEPILTTEQIALSEWMAEHYLCAAGEALFKMFPSPRKRSFGKSGSRSGKKARSVDRFVAGQSLNPAQNQIRQRIIESPEGSLHLVHGITGSGKTELYIHLMIEALRRDRNALLLVPEIALTVQMVERLSAVFGDELALLHSALTGSARFSGYLDLLRGDKRIAVGTRSAIFAPIGNLGLIIIDEEHDGSYKEHSTPRYDARQVAQVRARRDNARVLFGSATPRLELRHFAGEFVDATKRPLVELHRLTERATGALLAPTQIIPASAPDVPISATLMRELRENLKRGEQSILLLNRRGYNPWLYCPDCGGAIQCKSCAVTMTLHRDLSLLCHYCGTKEKAPGDPESRQLFCPRCGGEARRLGSGTQKLEEYLLNFLPDVRLERLDADVARSRETLTGVIERLLAGEVDILVGTQMIAKGLDAPNVTLVGVLQSDLGLQMPDFRAAERSFALLTQVAGRAGRGERPGRVFFEAFDVDNPTLALAARQDYEAFFEREIKDRAELSYPPFSRLLRLLCRSEEESRAKEASHNLALRLHGVIDPARQQLLGPVIAPLEKLHNQYRYHIVIKSTDQAELRSLLRPILADRATILGREVQLEVDFDPIDLL